MRFFLGICLALQVSLCWAESSLEQLWSQLSDEQKQQLLLQYQQQGSGSVTTVAPSATAQRVPNKAPISRDVYDNRQFVGAGVQGTDATLDEKISASAVLLAPANPSEIYDGNGDQNHTLAPQQYIFPLLSLGAKQERYDAPNAFASEVQDFGYALFSNQPAEFVQDLNIPVPNDYVLGPGDSLNIQLFGQENANYRLVIDRQGQIVFPKIGPVTIAGSQLESAKAHLGQLIEQHFIGVNYIISLGELRTIQIYVMGEAFQPGAYSITALSTISHALIACGGVSSVGSLRDIQVKRGLQTVAKLDLYQMLIWGNMDNNVRLQAGDTIFIPAAKAKVDVEGAVRRPARYELTHNDYALQTVFELAGGFAESAFVERILVERQNSQTGRMQQLTVMRSEFERFKVKSGDRIIVQANIGTKDNAVYVSGDYQRTGAQQWHAGMTLKDAIKFDWLTTTSDRYYSLLLRHTQGSVSVLPFSLKALSKGKQNYSLQQKDEIVILSIQPGRLEQLSPLVDILHKQARSGRVETVEVAGAVRYAGEYPYAKSMTVTQMLNQAGGILETAERDVIFVAQWDADDAQYRVRLLNWSAAAEFKVQLQDKVYVLYANQPREPILAPLIEMLQKQANKSSLLSLVTISGFVRFPGVYPLLEGMTAQQLIDIAGGFNQNAYDLTAELTRFELDNTQSRYIQHINFDLKKSESTRLRPNDTLMVKKVPNWDDVAHVMVYGEIRFPGTYTIAKGDSMSALLKRAGGITEYAYLKGAVLLRKQLQDKEKKLIDRFKQQLSEDLASLKLVQAQTSNEELSKLNVGQGLMSELETLRPTGRLVINFNDIINGTTDLVLADGDQLLIPGLMQEVTVIGEVQYPTSHVVNADYSVEDYIKKSGGLTARSDADRTYIIKASGDVVTRASSFWFRSDWPELEPGDTIVVPYDVESIDGLAYWGKISEIVFQIGTAAASFKAIGVF